MKKEPCLEVRWVSVCSAPVPEEKKKKATCRALCLVQVNSCGGIYSGSSSFFSALLPVYLFTRNFSFVMTLHCKSQHPWVLCK